MGENKDTTPKGGKPTQSSEVPPISSGDYPSVDPSPSDRLSTTNIQVVPPTIKGESLPTRRKIGKYSIIKEIGRGGMGVVYHAHQDDLNRDVALKVIPSGPDADQTEVARFQTEAETAANLHHPNIVPVYDVGTAETLSYLAMELIEGGSLYKLIDHKPLEPNLAGKLLEPVARAMHYAHLQGVIHRDLKPSNILLAHSEAGSLRTGGPETEDLIPKITDFGLVKRLDRPLALTQTGLAVGTPHYMAPEQALGKSDQISPLTDVYALGAILYEMLTGHPPFGAGSSLETMQQVVSRKPLPPSSLKASIPRELEEICLRCLEKKPENRFASALAVADALHRFLHRTEPPTILARAPIEPESSQAIFVRPQDQWYFWPSIALIGSILVGVISWRVSETVSNRRLNSVKDAQLEASIRVAFLQSENALLLADRGDFEGISKLDVDPATSIGSVVEKYRDLQLTPLHWDFPQAERVALAGDRPILSSFQKQQIRWFDFADRKLNSEITPAIALGRSKLTGMVVFVDAVNRLHVREKSNPTARVIDLGAIGNILIVQPFADRQTIGLSDGVKRWTLNLDAKGKIEPVALSNEMEGSKVLAISEHGDWLVETESEWRVLSSKNEKPRSLRFPGRMAQAIFSPTRAHVLAVLPNGSAKLFDFTDDRWIDMPADGYVSAAAFSADGNVVVMGTGAGTVRLWDVHSQTRLSGSTSLRKKILSVDVDSNQVNIVAVTEDGVTHGFANPARPFAGPAIRLDNKPFRDIVDIAFSGDGSSLYVTTLRGLSRWNFTTGVRFRFADSDELTPKELLPKSDMTPSSEYQSMSVRPQPKAESGDQVLVGVNNGKMALVNVGSQGAFETAESAMQNGNEITGIAHSLDGERTLAVTGSADKKVILRYWSSGDQLKSGKYQSKSVDFNVTAECFDHESRRIYLGCEDGSIRVWNPEDDTVEAIRKFECRSRVVCMALDTDGKLLIAGCADGNALVFDLKTGEETRVLKHRTEVRKVAFHNARPITAAADGAIRIWHPTINFTLGPPFRHADAITALSIRGDLLAAGSRDRTIRVWRLPK